jgi:presenilin 1
LIGGLAITFYKGSLWLQQIYLIILSSLMAYNFSNFPALATWILLGLLAVWDLIAVLCPFGPLKLLIEHSRKENVEIQGLLYASKDFKVKNNSCIMDDGVNGSRKRQKS